MREFFHGWRRKVGCVTLVMACAFMAGWVGSVQNYYVIECYPGESTMIRLNSWDGNLSCVHFIFSRAEKFTIWPPFNASTEVVESFGNEYSFDNQFTKTRWVWRIGHTGIAASFDKESDSITAAVTPYWSITIPLTLLSAYLILWPGKRTEPEHAFDVSIRYHW